MHHSSKRRRLQRQSSDKTNAKKITLAVEKTAKISLTKFDLVQQTYNFDVQTAFNNIFTFKESVLIYRAAWIQKINRKMKSRHTLFFIGQHYGTDLPKLIIFALTRKGIKLVYNQKVQINSILKTDNRISLIVQSNIPNDHDELLTHTIWSDNGTLKFKDN